MINAIAIDDEPLPLELLQEYCRRSACVKLQKTFTAISEAERHLQDNPVELLFLDIQMPAITGIEFCKKIPAGTMVIFTTAYSEYAVEGFELKAVDYLLKPFSFQRFMEAVEKARSQSDYLNYKSNIGKQFIQVRSGYSLVRIDVNEIVFIESFADYLDLHLENHKKIRVRMTLKHIAEMLPADRFLRVHRSFIVHLPHIEKVRKKTIFLAGYGIPVSSSYEEAFFKNFHRMQ